jgi:hypothetical protein
MPDKRFIAYLKKCRTAGFPEADCSELWLADKFRFKPHRPLALVRAEKRKTAKAKQTAARLRKTRRALLAWYRDLKK